MSFWMKCESCRRSVSYSADVRPVMAICLVCWREADEAQRSTWKSQADARKAERP